MDQYFLGGDFREGQNILISLTIKITYMNKSLTFFFFLPLFVLGQKVDLSAYKYVYFNQLKNPQVDAMYGITSSIADAFTSKGLIVANHFTENTKPPDLKSNPCLLLRVSISGAMFSSTMKIKMDVVNCNNEMVF